MDLAFNETADTAETATDLNFEIKEQFLSYFAIETVFWLIVTLTLGTFTLPIAIPSLVFNLGLIDHYRLFTKGMDNNFIRLMKISSWLHAPFYVAVDIALMLGMSVGRSFLGTDRRLGLVGLTIIVQACYSNWMSNITGKFESDWQATSDETTDSASDGTVVRSAHDKLF